MSNSRELSELASQITVQGDLITLPNLQILGNIDSSSLTLSGNFNVMGNTTIGNAGTDTVTINSAISYTGTLTGGTGVVNIGSGQIYKDASGNVGVGTASPSTNFHVSSSGAAAYITQTLENTSPTGFAQQIFRIGSAGGSGEATVSYAPGIFFAIGPSANDTTTPIVLRNNNGTERFRIDSAGNMGLGVIPSAWGSLYRAFELAGSGNAHIVGKVNGVSFGSNYYIDSSNVTRYGNTGQFAQRLELASGDGAYKFFTAPSGTAGNPITFTQAMTLTQDSNLSLAIPAASSTPFGHRLIAGPDIVSSWTVNSITGQVNFSAGFTGFGGFITQTTNGVERTRVTSAGNLLVGTTTDTSDRIRATDGSGNMFISGQSIAQNRSPNSGAVADAGAFSQQITFGATIGAIQFFTSGAVGGAIAERGRFTSGGYFKASDAGTYGSVAGFGSFAATGDHVFQNSADGAVLFALSSSTGANVAASATALPTGAAGFHFKSFLNAVAVYQVQANGNVQNTNNSYSGISSIRFKTEVVDSPSYIDKFMKVRFVNFRFKEETGYDQHKQFGVIAEELELVFPSLVDTTPDFEQVEVVAEDGTVTTESKPTGTITKSVKYSVLAQMQGKVIQELNIKIVNLEEQLAQVLTRLSNLENK